MDNSAAFLKAIALVSPHLGWKITTNNHGFDSGFDYTPPRYKEAEASRKT